MFKRKPQATPAVGSEGHMAISWAEPVPDAPYPMSDEEFARLPDDGWQYELILGRLVRMPSGMGNSYRAGRLQARLSLYVEERGMGYVGGEQGTFRFLLPEGRRTLAPDVSFTPTEKAPERGSKTFDMAWETVPDLAVEYTSPGQDLKDKIALWLRAGVRLLWVINPQTYHAEVWRPGYDGPVQILGMADYLDAQEVVPGFRVLVRDIL